MNYELALEPMPLPRDYPWLGQLSGNIVIVGVTYTLRCFDGQAFETAQVLTAITPYSSGSKLTLTQE